MKPTAHTRLPDPILQPWSRPSYPVAIGLEPNAQRYRMGDCRIIVGSTLESGIHLSISHPTRYPTWDEIAHARYTLVPGDITMAMLLPPQDQYINIHPNCFHLWQIPPILSPR